MKKKIMYNDDSMKTIIDGINEVSKCVAPTLGPRGRWVSIDEKPTPKITNDGVTIANSITLPERINTGCEIVKDAARKTQEEAGDGTTSTILLTKYILDEIHKYITAGYSIKEIKESMDNVSSKIFDIIETFSKPVESIEYIKHVATIASKDEKIGNVIAEAIDKVGPLGLVQVDLGRSLETHVEITHGTELDRGYYSPYMCNTDKNTVEFENPVFIVTNHKIESAAVIAPFIDMALNGIKKPIVLIASDFSHEVINMININKIKTGTPIAAMKAPGFGDETHQMLEDISVLLGATYVNKDIGIALDIDAGIKFGTAKKIVMEKEKTIITNPGGNEDEILKRIEFLQNRLEDAGDDYAYEKMQNRITRLQGISSMIYVGANTETEGKDKKLRIDDALSATKAAIERGVVVGGGLMFRNIAISLMGVYDDTPVGAKIMIASLNNLIKTIYNNSGSNGEVILNYINGLDPETGVDVDGKEKNFIESGIIDATKVIESVIKNSMSIAKIVGSTKVLIKNIEEKEA